MSVQLRLGTRKRIEFQGEGSEVAAGEVGPRKGRGREKGKKICCVCRPCRTATAEPVGFGMMHLMQKFSREKYRRSPARGRAPSVCCRPWVQQTAHVRRLRTTPGRGQKSNYEA